MDGSESFRTKHEEGSHTTQLIICEEPLALSASCSKERKKVKQALMVYRDLFCKLLSEYEAEQLGHLKAKTKALTEAAMLMWKKHQWENTKKQVGHVKGIEVGDQFQYRTELNVIGLHRQFSSGIDYIGKGTNSLATSIVVTDRYANAIKSCGSLVYIGQGGNPDVRSKSSNVLPHDQKLEGGNLALKNSMDAKSPVRVILKACARFDEMYTLSNSDSNCPYIYDGLYLVEKMTQERGEFGKLVFKFTMNRILEQPATCVSFKDVIMQNDSSSGRFAGSTPMKRNKSKGNSGRFASFNLRKRQKSKGCAAQKDVVRVNDVSKGKEKFPIRVVTSIDCVEIPPSFDYIVDIIYSERFNQPILHGCDCVDGCVDFKKCGCIIKNGGTIPYDCNKRLDSQMKSSLIYECGPSCKCTKSCINRVSQCGIQFQLEIFKTELKGWGVRTRSFIPSGSFVCEYIGEVHHNREAGSRLVVDDYIFNIGDGKGFIDATRRGNIGRFINHSCSPNLHVHDILYGHNEKIIPHKMLFAIKDIPAGRELSYNYNCCKGRIIKVGSNSCYCGSPQCNGHIYI